MGQYETDEEIMKRLSSEAGHIIELIKSYFRTPRGVDLTNALIFSASLAGHACHQAVKKGGGTFEVVTDKAGRNYYFGDDVNKYLLESNLNVLGCFAAVTETPYEEVISIIRSFAEHVGDDDLTVCGFNPKSLYEQVHSCWKGIFDNMTSKYCKDPSEWPVLFGIVVQNFLIMSLDAGASKEEAGRIAIECAVAVSKMDKDSF
ncbi:MAG: hypothetical protein K5643_01730 [Saccharofermentans sp.]|nr:hypothetical protein [Saccharofermentans sp.]